MQGSLRVPQIARLARSVPWRLKRIISLHSHARVVFFAIATRYDAVFGCQLLEDGPMRRAIWMALAGAVTSFALVAAQTPDDAILQRMKKDIFHLASDELQGRGVETKGNFLAGDYIAKQFADAGLKPGGPKG